MERTIRKRGSLLGPLSRRRGRRLELRRGTPLSQTPQRLLNSPTRQRPPRVQTHLGGPTEPIPSRLPLAQRRIHPLNKLVRHDDVNPLAHVDVARSRTNTGPVSYAKSRFVSRIGRKH